MLVLHTGKDLNARRSPKASSSGDVIDVTPEQPSARSEAPKQGSRGKKKGEKFRCPSTWLYHYAPSRDSTSLAIRYCLA